jgi:hypothetical protein
MEESMKATIRIMMDNSAFSDYPEAELKRILIDLAKKITVHIGAVETLRDINGNTVGYIKITR